MNSKKLYNFKFTEKMITRASCHRQGLTMVVYSTRKQMNYCCRMDYITDSWINILENEVKRISVEFFIELVSIFG